MRSRIRLWAVILAGLMMSLLLAGCSVPEFILEPQKLYILPKLPVKYEALNEQINLLLEDGAEYAPPVSGVNIQPVQLTDLDGDGQEEAVVFFRNSAREKPLQIVIYKVENETYEPLVTIEGSGTAVYSIVYADLDGDRITELVIGWRVNTELQALSVYALRGGELQELLRTNYVKYRICDLDRDEKSELLVLRADDEEGTGVADCYRWQNGMLERSTSTRLSMTMAELSRQGKLTVGTLRSGEPALVVTGVLESGQEVTDILTASGGELKNLVVSDVTGVSEEISDFRGMYPADMNLDSVTEVPRCTPLLVADGAETPRSRVAWYSSAAAGETELNFSTYHNTEDGWYLRLPDTWGEIAVSRSGTVNEAAVTFSYLREQKLVPFMRIRTFSGTSQEKWALRGNRFLLGRKTAAIYTGEILSGASELDLNEDTIRRAFSLITAEWTTGDN